MNAPCGGGVGWGLVYGDGGFDHYWPHLLNGPQIFTIQNESTIDPMVQCIRMCAKPHKSGLLADPVLWSTWMNYKVAPTTCFGVLTLN